MWMRILEHQKFLTILATSNNAQERFFQMGEAKATKKKKKKKPTGMKTQVPADTMTKINQLMKLVCNSHAQTRKFSEQV